jgi:hypothetical protein
MRRLMLGHTALDYRGWRIERLTPAQLQQLPREQLIDLRRYQCVLHVKHFDGQETQHASLKDFAKVSGIHHSKLRDAVILHGGHYQGYVLRYTQPTPQLHSV